MLVVVLGLVGVVTGCSASEPYLFKRKEFDRDSVTFNQPRREGEPVLICYNGSSTSAATVLAMAEAECARYGKSAIPRAVDERFGPCPLLVPMQAMFACEGETAAPVETKGKKKRKARTGPAPRDGAPEAAPPAVPPNTPSAASDGLETAPDPQAQTFDTEPETREDKIPTDAPL